MLLCIILLHHVKHPSALIYRQIDHCMEPCRKFNVNSNVKRLMYIVSLCQYIIQFSVSERMRFQIFTLCQPTFFRVIIFSAERLRNKHYLSSSHVFNVYKYLSFYVEFTFKINIYFIIILFSKAHYISMIYI